MSNMWNPLSPALVRMLWLGIMWSWVAPKGLDTQFTGASSISWYAHW